MKTLLFLVLFVLGIFAACSDDEDPSSNDDIDAGDDAGADAYIDTGSDAAEDTDTNGDDDEQSAASAACSAEDGDLDEALQDEMCDKRLDCEDDFTDDHHALCLDMPDCDGARAMFHECEMGLSFGEFDDFSQRREACRIELGFYMGACLH